MMELLRRVLVRCFCYTGSFYCVISGALETWARKNLLIYVFFGVRFVGKERCRGLCGGKFDHIFLWGFYVGVYFNCERKRNMILKNSRGEKFGGQMETGCY